MSAKEPSPHWLWVKESRGLEACVDVADGALVAHKLEVELADVVLEASDPVNLLCVTLTSFFFSLVNEFREFLDKVSNLRRARIRKRGADHSDNGGGEGARVVVGPGRAVQ